MFSDEALGSVCEIITIKSQLKTLNEQAENLGLDKIFGEY